jgi:uncharacterized membrane protein YidH (DUF202 family)
VSVDEGQAAERTVLAWVRTALAYGICAVFCLRLAAGSLPLAVTVLVLAAAGTAGVMVLIARRRRHTAAGVPVDPVVTAALAGLVAALGLGAAALVALH